MTLTQKQKRYIAASVVRKTRLSGDCRAYVYYYAGRFDVLIDSKFTDTFHELLFVVEIVGENQPYSQNAIYNIIEQKNKIMKLKRVSGKRSTRASRKFENAELLRNAETRKNSEQ